LWFGDSESDEEGDDYAFARTTLDTTNSQKLRSSFLPEAITYYLECTPASKLVCGNLVEEEGGVIERPRPRPIMIFEPPPPEANEEEGR